MKTKILFVLILLLAISFSPKDTSAAGKPTIILDPGHGGMYGGTAGYSGNRTGYYEKHANLEISKRIKSELEKLGFAVKMTRTADTHFNSYSSSSDLISRMRVANNMAVGNNDNSVFVSVHHNATTSPTYGGYETYYFNKAYTDYNYPPDKMQAHYSPESQRLANVTHNSVISSGVREGRGIVPNSLYVTRNAQMPAVLLEVGYMSNPTEERMIKTAEFQQKVAVSFAKGVNSFFNVYVVNDANGKALRHYTSKTDALNYAKTVSGSYVTYKKTGAVQTTASAPAPTPAPAPIPVVKPLVYGVYHSAVKINNNMFATQQEAEKYAAQWKNTRVVHTTTGNVVWSNYMPLKYTVQDGSKNDVKKFYQKDQAIAYAQKLAKASVIDNTTQDILWSNFQRKNFVVRSKDKGVMADFYNREEARSYAALWPNSELFDIWAQKVIYTNPKTTAYTYSPKNIIGKDRIATAIEVSKQLYPTGFASTKAKKTVVLATSHGYADALSAGPLAAHYGNAPILLNKQATLSANVEAEIKRLKANHIIMVGGTGSLSAGIESKLKGMGVTVERLSGADRYATNAKINSKLPNTSGVFVASGNGFPDALTAASAAVVKNWPIVLVNERLATPDRLNNAFGDDIVIIGGTSSVPTKIETNLEKLIGSDKVLRLSGPTRYETSTAVLNYYSDEFISNSLIVSSGANYPDALVSSTLTKRYNAPLFLVPEGNMPTSLTNTLKTNSTEKLINRIYYVGGTIPDSVKSTINAMQK
ncbi:cell wall-binding repeat-containing protein [Planococcus sp. 1R117A]|uniref:cell wall-binding repeat-containing protein n=1 Tax=Planococcus sp. 1R117A TaxID=3447020 RepID=UPI003EDBB798